MVLPHGILHNLPFGALYDGQFLIERQPISYAYSLVFLDLLAKRGSQQSTQRKHMNALVMGNPVNRQYKSLSLPEAENEVQRVVSCLRQISDGDIHLYLRGAASESRFIADIGQTNLLHIATHSLFDNADAKKSFILLADGEGRDGLLFPGEIYQLALPQGIELVVMSSCESGAMDVRPGDDPYGLTRAWFYAGAKRILSTYWPISDQSAADMMDNFYQIFLLDKADPAKALQLAKVRRIRQGKNDWIPYKFEGMPLWPE